MSLWNSTAPLPYSVQYNSDPRCRHQTYNRLPQSKGDSNKYDYCRSQTQSHPYIVAASQRDRKKQSKSDMHKCRYQGIKSNRNRKRKYMDMFGSDEEGQYEYNQSMLVIGPLKKKRICERDVMKTVCELNKPKERKQLIQSYYSNDQHCDVQQFTKMHDIETKKKKRAIRLHPSYAGFMKQSHNMNAEKAKQIANRSYVNQKIAKSLRSNKIAKRNDAMDCD